jgi:hypothetical protein
MARSVDCLSQAQSMIVHLISLPRISSAPSHKVHWSSKFPKAVRYHSSRANQFLDAVKSRRSYYELGRDKPVDDHTILESVKSTILHCPSSFNSQTARLVVLLNSHHEKLWRITHEVLEAVVLPENFEPTKKKIEGLRGGYGTVSTTVPSCPMLCFRSFFVAITNVLYSF